MIGLKICHWVLLVSDVSRIMLPNLKLIKKYYSVFFCTILFLLTAMFPLGRNNFIFEKSMYFPVIADNSHDLLRS